jgi:NitT/TauT family transport system permease protein
MKKHFLTPLLPLLILTVLAEVLVQNDILPRYLVPSPSDVFKVFGEDFSDLCKLAWDTCFSAGLGFLLAGTFGVIIGVLFSSARWIERAFYPYATFFQTVPIIAVAPLLVIWFGYGAQTVVISTFIVAIFPMIASTLDGIRSTDLALLDLFKLYRATRFQRLVHLSLPYALPQIFVGLRISSGLSVIGAIVGEFITGGGLGGFIDIARTRQRVDQVFAAILLASLIGLLFVAAVNLAATFLLRHWHPSEKYEKS